YVGGNMAFRKGGTATATLSDGTTKPVSVMTVGASNVNIFVGVNGPQNGAAPDPAAGAQGLSIQNVAFGMALLKPTTAGDRSSYYGLKATASNVSLVGLSALGLSVSGLNIEVNSGTDADPTKPNRVVDFTKGNLDGGSATSHPMSIATGGTPVTLIGFSTKRTQVSAADAI